MLGDGLALGWLDALTLRTAIEQRGVVDGESLEIYAHARLRESREHVTHSMKATTELLASVGIHRR
jgi:hypothetical protein